MFIPSGFHELVSGQRRGFVASALRGVLAAAEVPYRLIVTWRNRRFDRGRAEVIRLSVAVVSAGNVTLGGTGKSPLVKWLAKWFQNHGRHVGIVSRGYGSKAGRPNDEALELARALPGVPHVQHPNRPAAARKAIKTHGCDLILVDDGFQHRRLARDLDIVLLDATEPFGFGHVFPRGTLREPLDGLARANVICLSRADAVSGAERDSIRRAVAQIAPAADWCEIAHAPVGLAANDGRTASIATIHGQRVAAFCGIGNPNGFRHTLASAGCEPVAWVEFPDHQAYSGRDLAAIGEAADRARAEIIVCTQKDLVKIDRQEIGGRPLWALAIEINFLVGQDVLEAALQNVIDRSRFHAGRMSSAVTASTR
jgi:tetraacyldisaccharide 4'-kinase